MGIWVGMSPWKKSFGFRERIGLGVWGGWGFSDGILIPSWRSLDQFMGIAGMEGSRNGVGMGPGNNSGESWKMGMMGMMGIRKNWTPNKRGDQLI